MAEPNAITAILERFRAGKALTPEQIDAAVRELDAQDRRNKAAALAQSAVPDVIGPFDIVRANIPPAVQPGISYEIQGQAYQGTVEVPYCVYTQLCRMHQADTLAYRELFEKRGSAHLGLAEHIQWIPPTIPFQFVRKDTPAAAQERADRAAAYRAMVEEGRRRVA